MKYRGFEFEDQPWFPAMFRDSMTDYLRFLFNKFELYQPVLFLLRDILIKTNNIQIFDLCSGSGGAIEGVYKNLKQTFNNDVKIVLSDLFPSLLVYKYIHRRTNGGISYIAIPVDACAVPPELKGFRTMFSGFHHFQPAKAKAVLRNAIVCKSEIAIFDGGNKSFWMLLLIIIGHPIMLMICTPFLKPFRVDRLIFTYVIPVIPFCTIWDGIVSVIRLYTPVEMLQMAKEADKECTYNWESGMVKNRYGMSIAYLIGTPIINNLNA